MKKHEEGVWLPIPGYGGLYDADTLGNLRRVYKSKTVLMKPSMKDGTLVIRLQVPGGKRKQVQVHKLIQLTFLGPTPAGMVLWHKNGDKLDNCVNNLEFISRRELGIKSGASARRKSVAKINQDWEIVEVYPSARAAGKANYMSYQTVIDRCNGKVKSTFALDGYCYKWDTDELYA